MSEPLHSFVKTVVIRVKTNLMSGGKVMCHMNIDSDLPDTDALLGVITRAQFQVLHGHGMLHDEFDPLPELIAEVVGPVVEAEEDDDD